MSVHWTQPGLMALSETDGHGDTCGPIAMLDYLTLKDSARYPLTIGFLDTMRANLIAWGLMNQPGLPGMTIPQIATAFEQHYGVTPLKVVDYHTCTWAQFHTDLIAALEARQLVLMMTSNAAALPNNQAGVQGHFVLHGGIDSTLGYLTCNGDTYAALGHGGVVSPVWYSAGNLEASAPIGYIVLPALEGNMAGTPQGWTDDGTTLTAPNKKIVVLGFRDYVRAQNWDPADVPMENEVSLSSVELGNPAIGAGARQIFTREMLGSTTARGVYVAYTGQELMAWVNRAGDLEAQLAAARSVEAQLQQQLTAATAEIAQLQAQIGNAVNATAAIAAIKTALG